MGRPKTVEGSADSNTHTFYCSPDKWKAYQEVAKNLNIAASELLRRDIDATLEKFQKGDIKKSEFNLEKKQAELLDAINLEKRLERTLKDIVIGKNKTAIGMFRDYAMRFGSDFNYKKDFARAVEKMKTVAVDPSLRVKFVLYGQAILNRQAIETEIDTYLSGTGDVGEVDSPPLVEAAPLAA